MTIRTVDEELVGQMRARLAYLGGNRANWTGMEREYADALTLIEQLHNRVERLTNGFNLARNRLRAAAINEAPKGSREYYDYSQWASEADAELAALTGEHNG